MAVFGACLGAAATLHASSVVGPGRGHIGISEIMYYPPVPTPAEIAQASGDQNDYEFIELLNVSDLTLNLDGLAFTDGIGFSFTGLLEPGEFLLVIKNRAAFTARYGTNLKDRIAGEYTGRLANEGERIELQHSLNGVIQSVTYGVSSPWPAIPSLSSGGYSLELISPFEMPDHAFASNWRISDSPAGTPGVASDADMDGLPDAWEIEFFEDLAQSGNDDPDEDGAINSEEFDRGSDPTNPDTDGDGLFDGVETGTGEFVDATDTGTDPTRADTDGDGLSDLVETGTGVFVSLLNTGTDPNRHDTDGDGFGDLLELNMGKDPLDSGSFPVPPRIHYFVAAPDTAARGEPVTLFWLVEDADAVFVNQGIGPVTNGRGSLEVLPQHLSSSDLGFDLALSSPQPASGVFRWMLTASNAYATVTELTGVFVIPDEPPVIESFIATPATILPGETSTLSWSVQGEVRSVRVDPEPGFVNTSQVIVRPIVTEKAIPAASFWRFLDDGSDQGTNWSASDFDDAAWSTGPAPLGYGNENLNTWVSFGPDTSNKYITTYFRKEFDIADLSLIRSAVVHLMRDDGAVVYLNGAEIVRDNLPAGPIDYLTWAPLPADDDGRDYHPYPVPGTLFVAGRNVVAVEIHQLAPTSADIQFDLRLELELEAPTEVTYTLTASNDAGSDAAQVTVHVTPRALELVALHDVWRYEDSDADLGTAWREPGFDDGNWSDGQGVLGYEDTGPVEDLIRTEVLPPHLGGPFTSYYRKRFNLPVAPANVRGLRLTHLVDDGAVLYFNGQEIHRVGVPAGQTHDYPANRTIGNADFEGPFFLDPSFLVEGENVLAVELHQINFSTTDVVWGCQFLAMLHDTGPPVVLLQPRDLDVAEGETAVFDVVTEGESPLSLQWRRNGLPWEGATMHRVTIDAASLADAGDYDVIVSNALGAVTSIVARLTVRADLAPPALVSADMGTHPDRVRVSFSEPVDATAALDAARYEVRDSLGNPLAILDAVLVSAEVIELVTEPRQEGLDYELHVSGIPDRAEAANLLPPSSVPVTYRIELIAMDATWRFEDSGSAPDADWAGAAFDDAGWLAGEGPLGFDEAVILPVPLRTILVPPFLRGPVYYFRTPFQVEGDPLRGRFDMRHLLDDGAVVYLNGQEVYRVGVFEQGTPPLLANRWVAEAELEGSIALNGASFLTGTNWLAVSVHQFSTNDFDVVMGLELVRSFPTYDFIEPPTLRVALDGADLLLTWDAPGFVLESAPGLEGPWGIVPTEGQSAVVSIGAPSRFYRLRWHEAVE